MTHTVRNISIAIVLAIAIVGSFLFYTIAGAVPPTFLRTSATATATTTGTFMTPGAATTSITYDSYALQGTGAIDGGMNFSLGVQFAGSSTASTLCRVTQYSMDTIDWYFQNGPITASATTTFSTGSFLSDCFPFASTTPGLVPANGLGTSTTNRIVSIPIYMRYVRSIFYVPAGSTNGTMWAEVVGIKSRN